MKQILKIDQQNSDCTNDGEERIDEKGENKEKNALEDDNEKVEEGDEEEADDCEEEASKIEEVDILHIELTSNNESAGNQKQTLELQTLSIVFPWALSYIVIFIRIISLVIIIIIFELDASFEGLKPYVYCVSHAIFNNESVPLSITVAPLENHILYMNFFIGLNEITK